MKDEYNKNHHNDTTISLIHMINAFLTKYTDIKIKKHKDLFLSVISFHCLKEFHLVAD
jgi:hypothetical protein